MEAVAQVGRERPGDRRALQSVSVQFFANGVVYASFIPELPEIRDRVGISIGGLGLVLTLASISGLIGSLLTGRVIARFGTRNVVIVGTILSIGSLPIVGFATTPGDAHRRPDRPAVLRRVHRRGDERAGLRAVGAATHSGDEPAARFVEPRHGVGRHRDGPGEPRRRERAGAPRRRGGGAAGGVDVRRAGPAARRRAASSRTVSDRRQGSRSPYGRRHAGRRGPARQRGDGDRGGRAGDPPPPVRARGDRPRARRGDRHDARGRQRRLGGVPPQRRLRFERRRGERGVPPDDDRHDGRSPRRRLGAGAGRVDAVAASRRVDRRDRVDPRDARPGRGRVAGRIPRRRPRHVGAVPPALRPGGPTCRARRDPASRRC